MPLPIAGVIAIQPLQLQLPSSYAGTLAGSEYQHVPAADTNTDEYTGYRAVFQLDRFTAVYRTLVVFYLAMFIACYAQVVHTLVFWGCWCALVLMYWEPFLAPPYPWTTDYNGREECFSKVEKWGVRPTWLAPADAQERAAIRQYLFAVRRGLNQKQLSAYKFLVGLIILPCGSLWAGVLVHLIAEPLQDERALYSCCILLFLVTTYTLATTTSLVLHDVLMTPRLKIVEDIEIAWRTHDMMFFTCKILGETLNTTVQTLVAGAFVSFMPTTIFWLSIMITALSFTATNLLYGLTASNTPGDLLSRNGGSHSPSSAYGSVLGSPGPLWGGGAGAFGCSSNVPFTPSAAAAGGGWHTPHTVVHAAITAAAHDHHWQLQHHAWQEDRSPQAIGQQLHGYKTLKPGSRLMPSVMLPPWQELPSPHSDQPAVEHYTAHVVAFAEGTEDCSSSCCSEDGQRASQADSTQQQNSSASQPVSWQQLPASITPPTAAAASIHHPSRLGMPPPPQWVPGAPTAHLGASTASEDGCQEAQPQQHYHSGACLVLSEEGSQPSAASSSCGHAVEKTPGEQQQAVTGGPSSASQQSTRQTANLQPSSGAQHISRDTAQPPQPQPQQKQRGGTIRGLLHRHRKPKKPKGPPSPPFLVYKPPNGWRDWAIVFLLTGVVAPSSAILFLVSWGVHADEPSFYFDDPSGSCDETCFLRYRQILILLCTLGCIICYYAITVGWLQAGPVTWAYRRMVAAKHLAEQQLSDFGARIRMTMAGGRVAAG